MIHLFHLFYFNTAFALFILYWSVIPEIFHDKPNALLQVIVAFLWDHWVRPSCCWGRMPLWPVLGGGGGGGVCSLANYSVAYEETQSNRVFDFRGFVCSLLQRQSFLTFLLPFLY